MHPTTAGTIEDLVADGRSHGYRVSARLIRDWSSLGLLDRPQRRGHGRGKGSSKAEYPANQRKLLLVLLEKRHAAIHMHVSTLARVPIFLWLYFGDDYVPTRQAALAFGTWLAGTSTASRKSARESAIHVLGSLDHPNATTSARRRLRAVITDVAYTGRLDRSTLEHAARAVFQPDGQPRSLGHSYAPLTAESTVGLIEARLAAVQHHRSGQLTEADLTSARSTHHALFAEYLVNSPQLVDQSPDNAPDLYDPITLQSMADNCGNDLLTIIGLQRLNAVGKVSTGLG